MPASLGIGQMRFPQLALGLFSAPEVLQSKPEGVPHAGSLRKQIGRLG